MRVCVSHVYWMLLFTSVVSSAILFLIVASENVQNRKFIGPDRNQAFTQEENVTFSEYSQEQLEPDSDTKSSIKISSPLKPKIRDQSFQDTQTPISSSFDTTNKNEEEIEILKESLTQQPNLSQGISEGGQAVVLTLVDTASSLQNLADFRSKAVGASEGNASSAPEGEDELQAADNLVHFSKLLEANGTNETDAFYSVDSDADIVVVVRAEQKSSASIRDELALEKGKERDNPEEASRAEELEEEEDGTNQQQQLPKSPTPAPDLNDSAARARLTGSADDSAAVILDSLVTAGPSDPHEEIPSFNEWAQKRLEEAEKKKTAHPNASVQTANGSPGRNVGSMRMRSKNYASPDCGAKIVAANPEARSARSVLVSTRDEYMLNTCTSRVWFVVELCEAIQAKKIELANFELFSSSPKDISVSVSDRFPTRDWLNVGQFTARDERDIQSFSLQPQLFGKFIKVELHSHYGSEHFCPISLFRAYGTSEFEVLETETETDIHDNRIRENSAEGSTIEGSDAENEDDEDEDSVFEDEVEGGSDRSSLLFGSARDAVLSIVKKAAEVLIKSEDLKSTNNLTKIQESIRGDVLEDATLDDCTTPVYNVACRDCNDDRFARVFQLISCKGHYLDSLLNTKFFHDTLIESHLCSSSYGFDVLYDNKACTDGSKALGDRSNDMSNYYLQVQFLSSLFTPDYIIALCNVLAAKEQRLFANLSHLQIADKTPNKTLTEQDSQMPLPDKDKRVMQTRASEESASDIYKAKAEQSVIKSKLDTATENQPASENLATQIKPTKAATPSEDAKHQPISSNLETSHNHQAEANAHLTETPMTTESPVPIVTKRMPSSASKMATGSVSPDHAPVSTNSQETIAQREVPTASTLKFSQHSDNTQKLSEKSVNTESGEIETKNEEEAEAKTKTDTKIKVEPIEQEPKIAAQDQLNFEGFDFKDFEVENLQNNGGVKNDASATQQAASATTPQQKESVFLRLSNRIKALERNMSLSSQYLEELSRRYKKQVEEMQRSLERAMTVMNEESRKGEERENKHLEEITVLHSQIDTLTKTLDDLIYERNSWRISFSSLIQHILFVLFDVVLVILILAYCKRADYDLDYYNEGEEKEKSIVAKPKKNKSYEIVKQSCTQMMKKPKKRRPSEIASQISGTYDKLMIEDAINMGQLSKKDKRKKRKKDTVILRTSSIKDTINKNDNSQDVTSRESMLPSRSASASDALYSLNYNNGSTSLANLGSQRQSRPESAPDNAIAYFSEQQQFQHTAHDRGIEILTTEVKHESVKDELTNGSEEFNTSFSLEDDAFETQAESSHSSNRFTSKKFSSPSFMKTALGSRSKRISFSGGNSKKHSQSLDESTMKSTERKYERKMGSLSELETTNGIGDENNDRQAKNGHVEESDESKSSTATPTTSWNKKEKRSNGLKKMVRKFF